MPILLPGDIGRLDLLGEAESCYLPAFNSQGQLRRTFFSRFENAIVVKKAEDLLNIDSTKNYIIDGSIDMGSQSIVIPSGGISISGLNGARDVAILYSSEDNFDLFVTADGSYSGDVVMESCTVQLTGSNSRMFNIDNNENGNACELVEVNITDGICGLIDSYRLSGSVRSDLNMTSSTNNANCTLCNFSPSNIVNDDGFVFDNVRVNLNVLDPVPNMPASSTKARFRNCVGMPNTYVGGIYSVSVSSSTVISLVNTPVKMAGTTVYKDMNWFSNTTSNSFVYDSDLPIDVQVLCNLSFSGGNNDQITVRIYHYDSSSSTYNDIGFSQATLNGGGGDRAENVLVLGTTILGKNDRIEIWIENNTDTSNISVIVGGQVIVSERSS